ncbi:MAG: 6-carboxytetrahydropterin synthase [Endozoicomonadaceae bacterium]|nr:6-carboxytetrahydropterin synthase [Endozoicomonadaceae bacterium]
MNTLFVKKLTSVDFSFLCPERGLVGETWLVDVFLHGKLNQEGMVFDFGHVKKQMKSLIDGFADHKLLIPTACPSVSCAATDENITVTMQNDSCGYISCTSPVQAVSLLNLKEISLSAVTPLLKKYVKQYLPANVTDVDLHLYPEAIEGSFYHYSHGLKKHKGDCQRIAHGHRSKIEIFVDGERSAEAENNWANLWKDIYLASQEDISDQFTREDMQYTSFSYIAIQGEFSITLPSHKCYMIETDTTVELLSEHVAKVFKKQYPEKSVRIMLYEGVDKGAVSYSNNL